MPEHVLVIGVGNKFRGDDAVGIQVAQTLMEYTLEGVTVIERDGEGSDLITAWEGHQVVYLIDAVQSGAAPGTIHRFEAHKNPIPAETYNFSSHVFGVAEAIEIGRNIGLLPLKLVVYGVEGADFSVGSDITPDVRKAVGPVVNSLMREIG